MLGILAEAPEIFPRMSVDPNEVRWRVLEQMAPPDSERVPPNHLLPRTPRLDRALALAQAHAAQDGSPELRPEHLLLGVAEVEGSRAERTLRELALDKERLRRLLGLAVVAEDDAPA
jgi:ATP-dependent Clp protease ATP-binding subunit ClpA